MNKYTPACHLHQQGSWTELLGFSLAEFKSQSGLGLCAVNFALEARLQFSKGSCNNTRRSDSAEGRGTAAQPGHMYLTQWPSPPQGYSSVWYDTFPVTGHFPGVKRVLKHKAR